MLEKLLNLDSQLFLLLNSYHSPVWDKIMWFISGKYEWIPLYAILVGFLVFKYKWRSVYIFIAVALLVTLADQISTNVFKEGIKRLRPSHVESLQHAIHLFVRENGEVYRGGQYGFVSSHAANSFALATFLHFLFKRRWFSITIFIWAAIVSYSRIYLGVHYPGDIAGGALLGYLIGLLVYRLYVFLNKRFQLTTKGT
jgi:undecaprenyl-diphosphatase